MRKNRIRDIILILGIGCALIMSGCAAKEPVFVDAHAAIEESSARENMTEEEMTGVDTSEPKPQELQPVVVHVCGAVVNPGVYELPAGSRMADAVDMAGGLCQDADDSYVNLAGVPADGEQVYIPTKEESVVLRQEPQQTGAFSGKVNINTADKALLCTLPGIGDTRAAGIIAYRQEHGSFSAIEEIMQVSGIKESSFQKIKEQITVN